MSLLFSCDWGSSSFRIKLVSVADRIEVASLETNQGVVRLTEELISEDERKQRLMRVLEEAVLALGTQTGESVQHIPIVISGMASSTIGLTTLPYAPVPFPLGGEALVYRKFAYSARLKNSIWLLSGISDGCDVIRGEETQLIGVKQLLGGSGSFFCLMPGTHSKQIVVNRDAITEFRTFMTGELFDILSKHSVLRHCLDSETSTDDSVDLNGYTDDFLAGVQDAEKHPLLHAIFHVRTAGLFGKRKGKAASAYLSGLLIGNEVTGAFEWKGGGHNTWVVSGHSFLIQQYRVAIAYYANRVGQAPKRIIALEDATVVAHCYIYQKFLI